MTMNGAVSTDGMPMEQGGDLDVEFEFSVKIEREDIADEDGVPDDPSLDEPEFTPPPEAEDLTKPPEADGDGDGDGAFIPGFDVIASVAAIVGLSVIVRRKRRA